MKRDGAQQHDKRRRTRDDPTGHSQRHQLAVRKWGFPVMRVLGIVRVVMMLPVNMRVWMGVAGGRVRVGMLVRMVVLMGVTQRAMKMMVSVRVMMSSPAASKHVNSEEGDGEPGCDAQPGVEVVGNNILRRVQRDEPQRVNPGGVGDGDDQPKKQGMGGRSLRPHQVRRDNGFSVSRLERVQTSQCGSDERRGEQKPEAPLVRGYKFSEGVAGSALFIGFQRQPPGWRRDRQGD